MHCIFKGAKETPSNATRKVNTEQDKMKKENSSKHLVSRFIIFYIKSSWRPLIAPIRESEGFRILVKPLLNFFLSYRISFWVDFITFNKNVRKINLYSLY